MMLSNLTNSIWTMSVALYLLGTLSLCSAQQGHQNLLLRRGGRQKGLPNIATHALGGSIEEPSEFFESDDMLSLNASQDLHSNSSACQPETLTEDEIVFILSAISDSALIATENTPQNKAFQYVRDYPNGLNSCSSDAAWHQRYALAVFYNSIENAADTLSGWVPTTTTLNDSTDECNGWFRVYCYGDEGAVTNIHFPDLELEGTIPSEIAGLSALTSLIIFNSPLLAAGNLGMTLGNHSALRALWLDEVAWNGTVPSELGQLVHLKKLSLIDNGLTALPTELGRLSTLEVLQLNQNKLSTIPTEFGDLNALVLLQLDTNDLTYLPSELGKLVNLEYLGVENNPSLTLPLPPFICDLLKTAGKGGRLSRLECGHNANDPTYYSGADCCTVTNDSIQSETT